MSTLASAELVGYLSRVTELRPCEGMAQGETRGSHRLRPVDDVRLRLKVRGEMWSARILQVGGGGVSLAVDGDLAGRLGDREDAWLGYQPELGGLVWLHGSVLPRPGACDAPDRVLAFTF